MTDAVLEVDGLRRTFEDLVAVDSVSFAVAPGETYGLLGPNGAGKTTTISMIAGLLEPTAGGARVVGQQVSTSASGPKRAIGLVPQDLAIYPDLTARENLIFFGWLHGLSRAELTKRSDEVLDVVGLRDRADDRAEEYSGGMKRRLNIGIGLFHRPELLILDEPTVGVDPQSRNAILESVEHLSTQGMSVLYTTHYMEEAERLCDRVGIIDQGSLVAEGSRRQLVETVGEADSVELTGSGDLAAVAARLRHVEGVSEAAQADHSISLLVDRASQRLPALLAASTEAGMSVTGVQVVEPNLEAVFLRLTGKALRD